MTKRKPLDPQQEKSKLQQRVLDLTRQLLDGVVLTDITQLESLQGEERLELARFCHTTYNNPNFKKITDLLYYAQIMAAALSAPNYDIVTFNRASANGVALMGEIFQKWSNVFDTDYSGDRESFDPAKSFEPTIKFKE